jgi:hypothetical protein
MFMSMHVYINAHLGYRFGKAAGCLYQRIVFINASLYQLSKYCNYVVLIPILLYINFLHINPQN